MGDDPPRRGMLTSIIWIDHQRVGLPERAVVGEDVLLRNDEPSGGLIGPADLDGVPRLVVLPALDEVAREATLLPCLEVLAHSCRHSVTSRVVVTLARHERRT